jgi:hypothetical protein
MQFKTFEEGKQGKLAADHQHHNSKRKKRMQAFVADVASNIENDR